MKKLLFLISAFLAPFYAFAQSVSIGDILCTDGTTIKPTDFPTSGKTAEGIVFYVDNSGLKGWAANLHQDAINIDWINENYYSYGYDIPELPNLNLSRLELFDLDGYKNTGIIRATHGPEWYPAAWCVDFDNGWYLPAAGQMRWMLAYVNEINESLSIVNGTPLALPYPDWHWTSTETDLYHAGVITRTGSVSNYMKWNYIGTWNIGVRSVKTFSCESEPLIKIGDFATTPDGQQGIVFYVSPDNNAYWLVALNDLPSTYQWGSTYLDIPELDNMGEAWYQVHGLQCGYDATRMMRDAQSANPNYAANQVDFEHGWHIPSTGQITKLYASLPFISDPLILHGGTIPNANYWTSTEYSREEAYSIDFGEDPAREGFFSHNPKNYQYAIRPIWSVSCLTPPEPPLTVVETEFSAIVCNSYNWNDSTYTESGDHQQVFHLTPNCDSIVTLHLTINHKPEVSEIQGPQYVYYGINGLYTYSIDSVPGAFGYEWQIDNNWPIEYSPDTPQCTVGLYTKDKATLTVRVYSECGLVERSILIRHDLEPEIKIFPNPNDGELSISLYGLEGRTSIEVYNSMGQIIDRFEVNSILSGFTLPYSMKGKAAGVYFISITNNYDRIYKKVIKEFPADYGIRYY
jgi:hypothetical protein